MVTAAISIGGSAGNALMVIGCIILIIGIIAMLASVEGNSDGGFVAGLVVAVVGLVMFGFGGVGVGQGDRDLPDFSKACRGQIEVSVFKTDRRQGDVSRVEEAIEDELGCKDAVEAVIQMPFRSPYIEESQLEPPAVKLVPAVPQETSGFPGGISPNGGTLAPAGP